MIEDLAQSLATAFPDCTPGEIADVLWLIAALPVRPDIKQDMADRNGVPVPRSEDEAAPSAVTAEPYQPYKPMIMLAQGGGSVSGQIISATAVGLRAPATLSQPVASARALSPFKRIHRPGAAEVDIDATVEATADAGRLIVVTRAARERGLDVALVADTSLVMTAFGRALTEFEAVLLRTGAFRSVTRWSLVPGPEPRIRDRSGAEHQPDRLTDPSGRRLVLLVTDAVADHWHEEAVWQVLRRWAEIMPTAIIHVLPTHYRAQGPLGGSAISMRPRRPAAPNSAADVVAAWWDPDPTPSPGSVPVPVVPMRPDALARWAETLSAGTTWVDAVWARRPPGPTARQANSSLSSEDRVRAFQARASRGAQALARILAGAPVLSLPLMNVLQVRLLPGTGTSELAEVLVSGLLEREIPGYDDAGRFRFRPAVSELLRDGTTAAQEWNTYEAISDYLNQNAGTGNDIHALLADPSGAMQVESHLEPFAALGRSVMSRLGITHASTSGDGAVPPPAVPGDFSQEELGDRVRLTLERAIAALPSAGPLTEARRDLRQCLERFSSPLQVALIGRLASGKTTLANALLGSIAVGDLGDRTDLVNVIRYGPEPTLTAHYRDSRTERFTSTTFAALDSLAAHDPASIDYLEFTIPSQILSWFNIIDTPGIVSESSADSSLITGYLGLEQSGTRGGLQADALVAVFPPSGTAASQFRDLQGGTPGLLQPVTAVGALTKVEQLWSPDQPDPITAGRRIADRLMREGVSHQLSELRPVAADVAAAAGTLTEEDFGDLAALAALAPSALAHRVQSSSRALRGNDDFPRLPGLYGRLGAFGIVLSAELIRDGTEPTRLREELDNRTGMSGFRRLLIERFGGRAQLLKMRALTAYVRRLAADPDAHLGTTVNSAQRVILATAVAGIITLGETVQDAGGDRSTAIVGSPTSAPGAAAEHPDLLGPRSALLISESSYADSRFAGLPTAARSAEELGALLGDPQAGGFHVNLLRDPPLQTLAGELREFLVSRGPAETALVYLSGHGQLSPEGRVIFAASDTDPDLLAATGLDLRMLADLLDECPAQRQIVILDCSYSGRFADLMATAASGLTDVPGEHRSRLVITASHAEEAAFEEGFTAALVDGLRSGAADRDADGFVSVLDAYTYASQRLAETGLRQSPRIVRFGAGNDTMVLARSPAPTSTAPPAAVDPWNQLDQLPGLDNVRRQLRPLIEQPEAETGPDESRHPSSASLRTRHFVFVGGPGTGKTTAARLIGEIYRDLGALASGHVVVAGMGDLVAGYVGQTATRTNAVIDRALDGVLFIDEAYALGPDRQGFGQEAIDTLLTRMESDRDRLVVIMTGYPAQMSQFLDANPGLRARFPDNCIIKFEDYDPDALLAILLNQLRSAGIHWTEALESQLRDVTAGMYRTRTIAFSNARAMRELADEIEGRLATRVIGDPSKPADTGDLPERLRIHLPPATSRRETEGRVFMSYVREDSARAEQLQATLEAAGIPVWRDTSNLWPGEDWRAKIQDAINNDALVFLACFSSRSLARERSYQSEELRLAIEQLRLRAPGQPWLIPVRFDDCEIPPLDIGPGRTLTSIQHADLFGDRYDEEAQRLTRAILRAPGMASSAMSGPPESDASALGGAEHVLRDEAGNPLLDEAGDVLLSEAAADDNGEVDVREHAQDAKFEATLGRDSTVATVAGVHNVDVPWNRFSSDDYWRANYGELQAEDQEIIRLVSHFFIAAFEGRSRARRGIDVGSGTNLYPALLMLPWAEQILLTDFSASNVAWLRRQLAVDDAEWTWQPFWRELQEAEGYNQIGEPRRQLRAACVSDPGYGGVEQRSVFDLPKAQWDLGTMFFVAESITEDPGEFRAGIESFIGALKPGAPFATAFMSGSIGYPVADTVFPALPITPDDVSRHLIGLGASALSVERLRTKPRVRDGYEGKFVATGFASGR